MMTINLLKTEKSLNGSLNTNLPSNESISLQIPYHTNVCQNYQENIYYNCCENPEIIENRGEYVCKNCAIVHEPIMTYNINRFRDNALHNEPEANYPFQTLGCRTIFSLENLPPQKRLLFRRLAKLNKYFNNSKESNLKNANQVLFKVASQLELPRSIYQQAMALYQKVAEAKLALGRGIDRLLVGCLYIACKLNSLPHTIEDFSKTSQIPVKILRKSYRLILEFLNIKLKRLSVNQYITQFCIELGLSKQFQIQTSQIIELLTKNGINTNSNAKGFASAAIYLISKKVLREKSIRQKQLAELSKVSEVTIRKYIALIIKNVNLSELHL